VKRDRATAIRIVPCGEFSWPASLDMLASWQPVAHFSRSEGRVTLAFSVDGTFAPAAAAAWWCDGALCGSVSAGADAAAVTRQVARMFSLDIDATDYPAVGRRDLAIGRVMRAHAGLRPVLFPSPYEAAVWAVISQRIAQPQASRAKVALSEASGDALVVDGATVRCLPTPTQLLKVREAAGLTAEKIERLHAVARAALDGVLDAERLKAMGYDAALHALQAIRGIGPFWSSGIYLRACGVTEPFPRDEPRSVRALADAHGLVDLPSGAELERMIERLRPFGMWVSVLLRVAANRGSMGSGPGRPSRAE
jgi:DNA-3-methyladenine glycosylase II